MKKIFLVLLVSILCIISLCGCSKKTKINLGIYTTEGDRIKQSSVKLKESNEFEFDINPALSYQPRSIYKIEGDELILKVSDEEEYIFKINDENLIFKEGKLANQFVTEDTEFFYDDKK